MHRADNRARFFRVTDQHHFVKRSFHFLIQSAVRPHAKRQDNNINFTGNFIGIGRDTECNFSVSNSLDGMPAPMQPQFVEYSPAKEYIPTGSVRKAALLTNVLANISSFHVFLHFRKRFSDDFSNIDLTDAKEQNIDQYYQQNNHSGTFKLL